MTRIVKVYLNYGTKQQEIRRFPYDEGFLKYPELESKIRHALPSVRGRRFKLFWKGKFKCNLWRVTVEIADLTSIEFLARTRSKALKTCIIPYFQNISNLIDYVKWYMKCIELRILKSSMLWSSQLWAQFKQLRIGESLLTSLFAFLLISIRLT